ncbi:hypothetical protein F4801DRAFT_605130 [Xylaria longipes]|nr:hypothetical protein F4801DRAFT_605130 [Xylaria longipes]RYC54399.1 hypothetical protein CHU98_g11808 [Xylaria longipes]
MTELISLADLPAIPSSMDPIYIGPSAPLALPAAEIRAILRRTKSMSYQRNPRDPRSTPTVVQKDGYVEFARSRTRSPVRANSRCKRSVAPISRLGMGTRYPSEVSRRTNSPPRRPGSVELGSADYREFPSRGVYRPRTQSRATSSQRSPSRGRSRRRDATPQSGHPRREKSRQHNKRSNVSRLRQHSHRRSPSLGQAEHPSRSDADGHINDVSSFITKGAFRLYNYRGPELFRFPQSRSQPEPSWRAGDGFSDDEARPGFVFLMTGKHKRKRSGSLSAFGQLSLEAEDVVGNNAGGVASSQSRLWPLHGSRGKVRNAEVKELWPTRENFAESTITQKPRNIAVESQSPTPLLNSERAAVSKPDLKRTIPLKRMASGFENLRKGKRRSQSRHSRNPSLSFTRLLPEYEDQTGDDKYDGEEDGPYERMEDESEQESVAFEYTYTTVELEGTDSGSDKLGEDSLDDLDEDMQDTVLDSEPDEVPSSSCDLGQGPINDAHAISMARWTSSLSAVVSTNNELRLKTGG